MSYVKLEDVIEQIDREQRLSLSEESGIFNALRAFVRSLPTVAAPGEAVAWRPIESAPTDGEVLLFIAEDARRHSRMWVGLAPLPRTRMIRKPTHWMPLPAIPNASAAGREVGE